MPLGTEVGFCPGDIVLGGDPAPPRKGAQQPPLFDPLCSTLQISFSNYDTITLTFFSCLLNSDHD